MDYAKVINNQVTQVGVPTTGTLNGKTVSNYNLLPESTLLQEGWLPLTQNIPEYNEATQYIELSGYTIGESSVTANYTVLDRPVEPTPIEERVETIETNDLIQDSTIGEILENIIPSLMGG